MKKRCVQCKKWFEVTKVHRNDTGPTKICSEACKLERIRERSLEYWHRTYVTKRKNGKNPPRVKK